MTARTCPGCASVVGDDAAFCAECGSPVVLEPVLATGAAAADPETREMASSNGTTHEQPGPPPPLADMPLQPEAPQTAAWSYGPPPPPPGPPAPPGYAQPPMYPAPVPPPAGGGRNTGLLIGLVVASIVALAGIAAALLLTLGGAEEPVQAGNAASTTPAQTVVTQVIRERSSPQRPSSDRYRSRSRTRSNTPVTPVASNNRSSDDRDNAVSTVSAAQRRSAAESAVTRHWALIESGQYSAAFNLLASSATTSSESTWVSEHAEDALTSADLSVSTSLTSATTARVDVKRLRTVAESGCFTWTGFYDVAKLGGTWKIAKANLTRSAC